MGAAQCMPSLRRTAATDGPYAATRGQRLAPPVPAEDAAATSAHDTRRDRTPGALHGAGAHRGHADAEPGRKYGRDRKRGGEGQSVVVRVDIGGPRTTKKKKT